MNLVIPFASADAVLLRGRMSVLLALIEWMRDELSVVVVHGPVSARERDLRENRRQRVNESRAVEVFDR
jgi:hypothetical protein